MRAQYGTSSKDGITFWLGGKFIFIEHAASNTLVLCFTQGHSSERLCGSGTTRHGTF